jgi:hypothetical protein
MRQVFDFAHDLVRKVCNFSGSCASTNRRATSPAFRLEAREAGGNVTPNGKIEVFATF